jgi:hypothetical protein
MDQHLAPTCGGDDCCDMGDEASLGCSATSAPGIHPGAVDVCGNGIDEDCDGQDAACECSVDADNDGHDALICGGADCCDTGADTSLGCTDATAGTIHPGAFDKCQNGIDEDCDGRDPICQIGKPSEPARKLVGDEAVFLVAVFGDEAYAASNNGGVATFEGCGVDALGHLACGATWALQPDDDPHATFGADAVLYFSYLFPFYATNRETITAGGSSRTHISSAIGRFPVNDPDGVSGNLVLGNRQSASTSFSLLRTHYQMLRLMSYVYVIGGWAEAHTLPDGTPVPAGPTGTVERHEQ